MRLCPNCAKKAFTCVMAAAKECGHEASAGGMKWCKTCADRKKVCQCCGATCAAKPPKDDGCGGCGGCCGGCNGGSPKKH